MPDALPPDLHYVDDTQPGISRRKLRGRFAYFNPAGQRITDPEAIKRLNARQAARQYPGGVPQMLYPPRGAGRLSSR